MLKGPSHFLVSSVQFLFPVCWVSLLRCLIHLPLHIHFQWWLYGVPKPVEYLLEVLLPFAKSCFFILQILRNPPSLLLTAAVCLLLFPVSCWSYTASSFSVFPCFLCSFGFFCNSPHFVLTLTFLDCFVLSSAVPAFSRYLQFLLCSSKKIHAVFKLCIYVFVIEALHYWGCHMRSCQTLCFLKAFIPRRPTSTDGESCFTRSSLLFDVHCFCYCIVFSRR